MANFRFVVAVSPRLPMPSLCEGGVYCDDAATRDDLDYYSNDFARADTDAADYNRRFGLDDTRYEVRDSLEGVDVSDSDVLSSLVRWQLAAISAAVRDTPAYQAGRSAWSSNLTKGDNPHRFTTGNDRALWNLGWQDACDAGDVVSLAKPALPPKADKTPDDFPPALGVVNVAKVAAPALVANTSRACYWRLPAGVYHATGPDVTPSSTAGGYERLDSLMRLKGESDATIARICDASGHPLPEPVNMDALWLRTAEGVAFNMVGRIVAKLASDPRGTTKATDAYMVDGGKVEARGTMSLSGVTVRWVFVPSDPSGTRERQIITTHAVRLIAARMQSRLS